MANLFLDVKELLEQNDALNFINYENLAEDNKEFLLTSLWDVDWIQFPNAVYSPGAALLKKRCVEVSPQFPGGLTEIEAVIRQFTIRQTVISGTTKGTIGMHFIDREDQAIRAFIDDWRDKLWNRSNRFSFRKEDTIATLKLTQFNSSRKAIAEWIMYAVQPQSGNEDVLNGNYGSDDPQQAGDWTITFSFEHYDFNLLNR